MPPVVLNPTQEVVTTKMQGAWFTFKPDSRKPMDEDKCRFIAESRKDTGLVILPDQFNSMSEAYIEGFDKTAEGKAILEAKRAEGIANLLDHHKDIIRNNQVSLRKDLVAKFPTGDQGRMALLEMSEGEQNSLRMVAKYQKSKQDVNDSRVKELEKLLAEAGPVSE